MRQGISFSTFDLKILALILMVIDHIGYYFPGSPDWLRWLGRGSYPLFLFCMVWGYSHTRSRGRFLLRLYGMSLFMTAFVFLVDWRLPTEAGYGNMNIFLSMFLVGVLISAIELYQRDKGRGGLLLAAIFLVQLLYYQLPWLFPALRHFSGDFLTGIIPNLIINEYGFSFVVLGVLLYFLRERRELLAATYIIFCIYQFSEELLFEGTAVQCLMLFALPFILCFNGQKGPGMKWFFYIFYPAHTFILFYLANFVFNQG